MHLEEADELLSKGDIIQASEKYYKAAEEAIKILASLEGDILSEVMSKNWNIEIIDKAVFKLSLVFGK